VKGYCKRGHLIEGTRMRGNRQSRFCIVCKNNWRRLKRRLPRKITDRRIGELAGILAEQFYQPRRMQFKLDAAF